MNAADLYRVVVVNPYLDTEEEFPRLTVEEAAHRADDATGIGADTILSDLSEDTLPWEHVDQETGKETTITKEIS